jgi:hypothetical protein
LNNVEFDSIEDNETKEEELQTPSLRGPVQEIRKLERYMPPDFRSIFVLSITDNDPIIVRDAFDSECIKLWKKTMVENMDALDKNKAHDIVELPTRTKPIGRKWVFKKKLSVEGKVEKYKVFLVEKGYSQVKGIDFGENFSLVAKLSSIRFVFLITTTFNLEVE